MSGGQRVLVCDGDGRSVRALQVVLRAAGFVVDATASAEEALDAAALRTPAAAIVELALPDGDGVDVCRRLREWSAIPLLVLSAVDEEREKVRALEAGADDYVTKPFAPRELVARVRATLRRAGRNTPEPRVEVAGLTIDLARRAVHRRGEEVHLTPIEYRLLTVLLRDRGRLLTHQTLLRHVWGSAYVDDTQPLRTHMANLRRKIECSHGAYRIRNTHGVGYRFEVLQPPPQPLALSARGGGPRERTLELRAA